MIAFTHRHKKSKAMLFNNPQLLYLFLFFLLAIFGVVVILAQLTGATFKNVILFIIWILLSTAFVMWLTIAAFFP